MFLAVAVLAALASPPDELVSKAGGDLLISCLSHFKKAKLPKYGQNFCACYVVDFASNISDEEIEASQGVMTERIQSQLSKSGEICLKGQPAAVKREGWKWINQ